MQMRCRLRGGITVFLALMMSVISMFIIALSKSVRMYSARCEASASMDNAVRSCFAEYNRELFEDEHILLIDSSYKGEESGIDRIEEHFMTYLKSSMSENEVVSVKIADAKSPDDRQDMYYALTFTAVFANAYSGEYSLTKEYAYDPSPT